jgi:Ankyrin repeats (many copies)
MHHELPQRLDLEWYRKRARELVLAYAAGDAEAHERVGVRQRFKLSDAQHLIAVEHGYRNWAEFKRWLESRSPEPPVGRIGRAPLGMYSRRAEELVQAVAAGDADALRRVRHHVPRLSDFGGRELDMREAQLVVAREYGFLTWRDLLFYAKKAIDEHDDRPTGKLAEAFELIRNAEVERLRKMLDDDPALVHAQYRGAAATMLEAIAQPDVFGEHLGTELGVDRRIVALLIERGSALETPLNLAACFNRAELVRMLIDSGARVDAVEIWGITPLQTAVYHGAREAADLLAEVALVPDALYIAAGAGRLDHLAKWFDTSGALKPEALRRRPNLADVGWPPAPPPRDEPQDVLDEAFALAAFSGRQAAMAYLLERGADVNGSDHLGLTALHMAVMARRVDTARWLVEHGADPQRRDGIHHGTPIGWAERTAQGSEVHAFLASLAQD